MNLASEVHELYLYRLIFAIFLHAWKQFGRNKWHFNAREDGADVTRATYLYKFQELWSGLNTALKCGPQIAQPLNDYWGLGILRGFDTLQTYWGSERLIRILRRHGFNSRF